ncbi:hypothetical protein, partial [Neisseria gonorrhoeae]|uniref:hypothetical protein n=1 Tax=Neisseria gonorrhoeae TaxID=485 RepID=UPI001BFCD4E0
ENDRRTNSEPTWLWEDGKIPEGLETTVSNTAIAARSLLKHVVEQGCGGFVGKVGKFGFIGKRGNFAGKLRQFFQRPNGNIP